MSERIAHVAVNGTVYPYFYIANLLQFLRVDLGLQAKILSSTGCVVDSVVSNDSQTISLCNTIFAES